MKIETPEWVKHAVFYQIFPDRFARGRRMQHPRGITLKPWGSPPEEQGYQGGDLYGIIDKLDYLQALGVNALYLNPIFASASNHRYHTYDYYAVDPLLGGNDALRALLDAAHACGIRIVLDGVFNHTGRGFWAFHHILENGADSPYLDWFLIQGWPLRPYASDRRHHHNYAAWWDLPALPKLNFDNPGVRDYILDVARYWIDFGIDGWRLDVPSEIEDETFWREFRREVKAANSEAYLCGEIWGEARRWLQGDQFDAVMNYLFMRAALGFFGGRTLRPDYKRPHLPLRAFDARTLDTFIRRMHGAYDPQVNAVQLNLLDSHDTPRALWIMGEDKSALRLCVLFQMTMPGAPCIYYGDEIGLSAADDPHCRGAFPWNRPEAWDDDLLAFYRKAAALRQRHEVLRTGAFETLYAAGSVYAFRRVLDGQDAVVIFNVASTAVRLSLPLPPEASSLYSQVWPSGETAEGRGEEGRLDVTIPSREARVFVQHNGEQ